MTANPAGNTRDLVILPIEALRALACLMVVYCHMVGRPIIVFKENWEPHSVISKFITTPLGIIQDFGFLGVALFFLISGFIVTHTSLSETRWSFLIKRLFRIYPALFVAVGATMLLIRQAVASGMTDGAIGIGYTNAWLSAFGMDTRLTTKGVLAVGWTITIELLFYAHILVLLPFLKSRPVLVILLFTGWSVLLTYVSKIHPDFIPMPFGALSLLCAFFPIFSFGMIIYFSWCKRIVLGTAILMGLVAWVALIMNFRIAHPGKISTPDSHTAQVAYALFIFLSALWVYNRGLIINNIIIISFANISYSLYLVHLPFGVAITSFLYPRFGLSTAMAVGFISVVVLAFIIYLLVERPAQKFGRMILSLFPVDARPGQRG